MCTHGCAGGTWVSATGSTHQTSAALTLSWATTALRKTTTATTEVSFVLSLDLCNAEVSPGAYRRGPRFQEVVERGNYRLQNATLSLLGTGKGNSLYKQIITKRLWIKKGEHYSPRAQKRETGYIILL